MYKEDFGNIPSREKVRYYLEQGFKSNPNKWIIHSYLVGETCKNLAKKIGLDPDIAYACGSLHDIGKGKADSYKDHMIEGYRLLRRDSYFFPARICLTHTFVVRDLRFYEVYSDFGKDKEFLEDYLNSISYTDYDRLIQLVDISIKHEYLGIENRFKELSPYYKDDDFVTFIKGEYFKLEEYFENLAGGKVSDFLPEKDESKFPYTLF